MSINWTKVEAFFNNYRHHLIAIAVVVFGSMLMFAGKVEGEEQGILAAALVDAGRFLLRNRQIAGLFLVVLGLAAVYTPRAWFTKNIVNGWSWRVGGCYLAGAVLGTAAMLTTIHLGEGWAYAKLAGVLYFVAIVGMAAMAAHWDPATHAAPSFGYLGWMAGFMALVPAWMFLISLVNKTGG